LEFLKRFIEPIDENHKRELAFEKGEVFRRNIFYSNADQMVADILKRVDSHNVYVSVCSFNEYNEAWIDRLFFDFDAGKKEDFDVFSDEGRKTLEDVFNEAKRLALFLEERYEAKSLILFTGNRGFHVYIFTIPVLLKSPKETLKRLGEWIIKKLDLKYVDVKVIGDIRRVARAPYSKHQKTGLFCVPVTLDMSIDEVIELAKEPKPIEWSRDITDKLAGELLALDKEITKKLKEVLRARTIASEIKPSTGYLGLPCMRVILSRELPSREATPGGEHGRRMQASKFLAIAYYLDHGTMEGFEEVAEIFARQQRSGHPLRTSEVTGWARWINQLLAEGKYPEWNCKEIEKYIVNTYQESPCSPDCPYKIAYREWLKRKREEELSDILKDFQLIKLVRKYLDKWVLGEKEKKLLLFLILLNNQNAFIVGDTSTGKTNLVDSVLRLFKGPIDNGNNDPNALVYEVSAMTEKALRWIDRENLPILYVKEMPPELQRFNLTNSSGMDLKLLMSDKKIIIWYVDASHRPPVQREREISVDAVIWTTTATELPEDFENRAWIISTDQSPELTAKVVEWKASRWANIDEEEKLSKEEFEELLTINKAIRFLRQNTRVIIPYAKTLTKLVNTDLPRARRDIDKIMELICAVTKTNYTDRRYIYKPTGEKVLIAKPEDGIFALGLIRHLFPKMQLGLEERLEKAYMKLREIENRKLEANEPDIRVTVSEFSAELGVSTTKARQLLKTLVYKGVVREEKEGNRNMYSTVPLELKEAKLDFSEIMQEYEAWWSEYGDLFEKE